MNAAEVNIPDAPGPVQVKWSGHDAMIGRLLAGRYRIERVIAKGGMGRVYRAMQEPLGRPVALKVLSRQFITRRPEDFHRRFLREASCAAQLSHPHSVTVIDYGCEPDGTYFLVMEFLRGETLGALLAREGRLPLVRAVHIASQVAWALAAAHAMGVVHRDLKPANIFLQDVGPQVGQIGPTDFVKVVDFGLVKQFGAHLDGVTETGQFLGSPGYMAPEQIRGEAIDARCDIYALGAVLFEMLTGVPPFVRGNPLETMVAHVHEPLPPMAKVLAQRNEVYRVSHGAEALVIRAMQKVPDDRFATMGALQMALADIHCAASLHRVEGHLRLHEIAHAQGGTWAEVHVGQAFGAPTHAGHSLPQGAPPSAHTHSASAQKSRVPKPPEATALKERGATALWGRCFVLALLTAAPHGQFFSAILPSRLVTAHLKSAPSGAAVWLGNERLCHATPCQVILGTPGRDRHVSLRFVHPAYEEFVATRRLNRPSLQVSACLRSHSHPEDRHQHLDENQAHDGHLDAHGLL